MSKGTDSFKRYTALIRFFASTYEGIDGKTIYSELFDQIHGCSFSAIISLLIQKASELKGIGLIPNHYDAAFAGLSIDPKAHIALIYQRYFRLSKKIIASLLGVSLKETSGWIKTGRRAYVGDEQSLLFQPFERGLLALCPDDADELFISFDYFGSRRRHARIRVAIWIVLAVIFVLATIYFALFATGHFSYGR